MNSFLLDRMAKYMHF